MSQHSNPEDLSTAELQQMLRERRQAAANQRLSRLSAEGRIVALPGAPPPDPAQWAAVVEEATNHYGRRAVRRRRLDQTLFAVELLALIGLAIVATRLWQTNRELDADLAAVRQQQIAQIADLQAQAQQTVTAAAQSIVSLPAATALATVVSQPTSTPAPTAVPSPVAAVINIADSATWPTPSAIASLDGRVILPGGHQPPTPGEDPQPGEAGEVPEELLPALLAYTSLPTPAAAPELALRIRIPAIGVDSPVVQGDDWEQLKLGVGQTIGSALPGQLGNVVLSAHNDIYGELFRDLDRLVAGNEIILSTASRDYTYIIEDARIVAPSDVWVMAPTEQPQVTLISCFPYRINTHRIAVFGRLVEPQS